MAEKIFTASKEDFELFLKNIEKAKRGGKKESPIEALMKRLEKGAPKNNGSRTFPKGAGISMLA